MMCDELDIAYESTRLVMGSTEVTPDQGGSGGSDAIERDGVAPLTVSDGTNALHSDPSRKVTYATRVGGKRFNFALEGRNVDATGGKAAVKPVNELRVVGKPILRYDIPAKVDGSLKWAVDIRFPGMVHARNVRPPLAHATLVRIDESSVAKLPGFIRVVSHGNYVAVVCEREEQAIRAAQRLKLEWKKPAISPFPTSDRLFD